MPFADAFHSLGLEIHIQSWQAATGSRYKIHLLTADRQNYRDDPPRITQADVVSNLSADEDIFAANENRTVPGFSTPFQRGTISGACACMTTFLIEAWSKVQGQEGEPRTFFLPKTQGRWRNTHLHFSDLNSAVSHEQEGWRGLGERILMVSPNTPSP